MAIYAIGDVQGCVLQLEELLEKIRFDQKADQLWLCGDIINRGPGSLETLRLVKDLGKSAICVLGNHDLHYLAVAEKIRRHRAGDTLKQVLKAPDREELTCWLRKRPLVHVNKEIKTIMVHAGVYPGWSKTQLVSYASEVEKIIRGKTYKKFLRKMYGKRPLKWNRELTGWDRCRFIINVLTRMRYCDKNKNLNFSQKGPPGTQYKKWMPWYLHPDHDLKNWRVVFGHWSSLGYRQNKNVISLDSGCVWGGRLTVVQLDAKYHAPHWQLDCSKSQRPQS